MDAIRLVEIRTPAGAFEFLRVDDMTEAQKVLEFGGYEWNPEGSKHGLERARADRQKRNARMSCRPDRVVPPNQARGRNVVDPSQVESRRKGDCARGIPQM